MEKLKSPILLTVYTFIFIGSELLLNYLQSIGEITTAATFTIRTIGWINGIAAIIEATEIAFGLEVKVKIKEIFENGYSKFTKK